MYDEIFETDNYLGNQGKDDLVINDLTFLLCSYSESICHEIIDQTWVSTGITMDRSKSRFTDDISGSSGTVWFMQDIFGYFRVIQSFIVVMDRNPLTQSFMVRLSENVI